MLAKAQEIEPKTSIALQNGGGIRATIQAGDLTVGNILTTNAFRKRTCNCGGIRSGH